MESRIKIYPQDHTTDFVKRCIGSVQKLYKTRALDIIKFKQAERKLIEVLTEEDQWGLNDDIDEFNGWSSGRTNRRGLSLYRIYGALKKDELLHKRIYPQNLPEIFVLNGRGKLEGYLHIEESLGDSISPNETKPLEFELYLEEGQKVAFHQNDDSSDFEGGDSSGYPNYILWFNPEKPFRFINIKKRNEPLELLLVDGWKVKER